MPEFLQPIVIGYGATAVIYWLAGIIARVFVLWIARVERTASSIVADRIELIRQAVEDGELDDAHEKVVWNDQTEPPDTAGRVIYLENVIGHRNLRLVGGVTG